MQTKKEFHYFTIFNHQKEEAYLREMHKKGWKFTNINKFGLYHFEECVPEDVVYQLDYNKVGTAHLSEYILMFEDCGWEYLQQYAEYSYFRKPASEMNGEEEIFSDDSSRVAMMGRVFKGRMIPMLICFCLLLVPSIVSCVRNGFWDVLVFDAAVLIIYIVLFTRFTISYFRVKNGR